MSTDAVPPGTEHAQRASGRATTLTLIGVAASSGAGLVFEIALTRVFAVAQFYHFAFLSVSLALLGFGASGSALAVFPRLGRGGPRGWGLLAACQSAATLAAYLTVNTLPFDSFAIAWDRRQIGYLALYYLSLAVPFFFGGLLVAVLLSGGGEAAAIRSNWVYGASLAGSGTGSLLAIGALDSLGAEGTVMLAVATSMAAAVALVGVAPAKTWLVPAGLLLTFGGVVLAFASPGWLDMRLSPYKDLTGALRYPGAAITETVWDRGTRIDAVRSEGIRSLPGLSLASTDELPSQDGLTFDGDDLSPVVRVAPEDARFADDMLSSLAFELRPGARVLILEPRGGLDVLVALANGAASVHAVEPHPAAVRLVDAGSVSIYDDPRVTVSHLDPRTFVERSDERYDIIDLALTSPYRPVASGAYSLAEDYRYTIEAFERYLDRLAPDGLLMTVRWVQVPASEETRLLATAVAALRNSSVPHRPAVVALRSYSNALLLVKPAGFNEEELAAVGEFAESRRFDIIAAPVLDPTATNRYNVVPDEEYSTLAASLLGETDPEEVYRASPFDIEPSSDDHPFFGHFFTWSQTSAVFETLGRTWQPFGGAGFFVLIALLGISSLAAIVLIAAPVFLRRRSAVPAPVSTRWWTLGYFGLLGVAFLFVEIPLIQQYILLVGHPAEAFAVVLFAILLASGAGSAVSRRVPWRAGAVVLTLAALVYPALVRWSVPLVLPASAPARMLISAAMVAPLGFLMGIMFPKGIAHLENGSSDLVPWAWAINGTLSVVGAAAAAILALAAGFSFVVRLGAVAYLAAALMARPRRLDEVSSQPG